MRPGIPPCYTTVPPLSQSAVCALPRLHNPPTLLSTTTREMVIRYGLEVARDTPSLFLLHVSHMSGPCWIHGTRVKKI